MTTRMGVQWALRESRREDAAWMAELRAEVLRSDLERLGRFDEKRVRTRFLAAFEPAFTRVIVVGSEDVGLIAVRPEDGLIWIEHFYLRPDHQGQGVGSGVLAQILTELGDSAEAVRLNVLQGSDARRLYERHGFVTDHEDEIDVFMRIDPAPRTLLALAEATGEKSAQFWTRFISSHARSV